MKVYNNFLLNLIKDIKIQIIISSLIVIIGFVLGGLDCYIHNTTYDFVKNNINIYNIFINNLIQCSLIIILGFLSLGFFSILFVLYNCYIMGFTIVNIYKLYGIYKIVQGILPHFFIEIFSVIIALSFSFETLIYLINYLKNNEKKKFFTIYNMKKYINIYIFICIILFISSIVECLISKNLIC